MRGGGMLCVGEVVFVAVPGETARRLCGVSGMRTGLGVVLGGGAGGCFCLWEIVWREE